jgi:proteasome lid subunit RPN8/RPN11
VVGRPAPASEAAGSRRQELSRAAGGFASLAAMRIEQRLLDEIVAHAREDLPNECCGMVGGADGEARTVYRAANAEASPFRYSIDSKEQFRLMKEIEDGGEDLVAIYHSHTKSPAYPSQTDVNLAGWPDAVYLIASLADPDGPEVNGFWIRDGDISDAEIVVS